jgi:hypothetical protein
MTQRGPSGGALAARRHDFGVQATPTSAGSAVVIGVGSESVVVTPSTLSGSPAVAPSVSLCPPSRGSSHSSSLVRINGSGSVSMLSEEVLLLLPLAWVPLSKGAHLKWVVDLVVRVRGDVWEVLLLLLCVSEHNLDTMPARFGGRLRVLPRVRRGKWFASAGFHVRLGKNFIIFQNGRWSLRDIRLRSRRRLLGYEGE